MNKCLLIQKCFLPLKYQNKQSKHYHMRESIQRITAEHITTLPDVRAFVWSCINELHLAFHPDTPFEDYSGDINGSAFTEDEAQELQNSLEECLDVCDKENVDICEIAMEIDESNN